MRDKNRKTVIVTVARVRGPHIVFSQNRVRFYFSRVWPTVAGGRRNTWRTVIIVFILWAERTRTRRNLVPSSSTGVRGMVVRGMAVRNAVGDNFFATHEFHDGKKEGFIS